MSVKGDDRLCIRLLGDLRGNLKKERQRISRAVGVEVRESDLVRAMITYCLKDDRWREQSSLAR